MKVAVGGGGIGVKVGVKTGPGVLEGGGTGVLMGNGVLVAVWGMSKGPGIEVLVVFVLTIVGAVKNGGDVGGAEVGVSVWARPIALKAMGMPPINTHKLSNKMPKMPKINNIKLWSLSR